MSHTHSIYAEISPAVNIGNNYKSRAQIESSYIPLEESRHSTLEIVKQHFRALLHTSP